MATARYTVTTKGSCTTVHRIGKAVGPIVRGTSFGSSLNGSTSPPAAPSPRRPTKKNRRESDG